MPCYDYKCANCGIIELFHSTNDISEKHCDKCGSLISKIITAPSVRTGSAFERCDDVRDYVNKTRPKYITDEKGRKKRFPKGGI